MLTRIEKFDRGRYWGEKGRNLNPTWEDRVMDIVTILIIVILVLLAIYLFQRVF